MALLVSIHSRAWTVSNKATCIPKQHATRNAINFVVRNDATYGSQLNCSLQCNNNPMGSLLWFHTSESFAPHLSRCSCLLKDKGRVLFNPNLIHSGCLTVERALRYCHRASYSRSALQRPHCSSVPRPSAGLHPLRRRGHRI